MELQFACHDLGFDVLNTLLLLPILRSLFMETIHLDIPFSLKEPRRSAFFVGTKWWSRCILPSQLSSLAPSSRKRAAAGLIRASDLSKTPPTSWIWGEKVSLFVINDFLTDSLLPLARLSKLKLLFSFYYVSNVRSRRKNVATSESFEMIICHSEKFMRYFPNGHTKVTMR